jgi:hypothetical protein
MVLEFCEDGCLYDQIERQGKINEQQAVEILGQLMIGFAVLN